MKIEKGISKLGQSNFVRAGIFFLVLGNTSPAVLAAQDPVKQEIVLPVQVELVKDAFAMFKIDLETEYILTDLDSRKERTLIDLDTYYGKEVRDEYAILLEQLANALQKNDKKTLLETLKKEQNFRTSLEKLEKAITEDSLNQRDGGTPQSL